MIQTPREGCSGNMFDITSKISAQRDYDRDEDEFIGDDDGTGRNPRKRS